MSRSSYVQTQSLLHHPYDLIPTTKLHHAERAQHQPCPSRSLETTNLLHLSNLSNYWQRQRNSGCRRAASRMPPSTRTHADGEPRLRRDVIHDIVRAGRIRAHSRRNEVQLQRVPRPPRNIVIGTGRIAADPKPSDDL